MIDAKQAKQPLPRASRCCAWLPHSKRLTDGLARRSKAGGSRATGFELSIIVVALMLALMLWALPRADTEAQSALHAPVTADHSSSFAASR